MAEFFVYVLKLSEIDGYYVGMTSNPTRRFEEHRGGEGARVTRAFGVAGIESCELIGTSKAKALRVEQELTVELAREYAEARVWGGTWCEIHKPCRPRTRAAVSRFKRA